MYCVVVIIDVKLFDVAEAHATAAKLVSESILIAMTKGLIVGCFDHKGLLQLQNHFALFL